MVEAVVASEADEEQQPRHVFQRPPSWIFHLTLVPAATILLYSHSFPGIDLGAYFLGSCILAGAALVWVLRVGTFLWARHKRTAAGSARWIAVAPLTAVLVVIAMGTGVPLKTRWQFAQHSFERALRTAPAESGAEDWVAFDVPRHIGSYEITRAYRVGNAVILYESKGAFSNDAGFAHLPSGPFEELESGLFEAPEFHSLGDDWYVWTASW